MDDGEYFNPDYVECERVLDVSVAPDPEGTYEQLTYYLVKWRSLPYEDATWELEPDVDKERVQQFMRWRDPPDEDEQVVSHSHDNTLDTNILSNPIIRGR